MARSISLFAYVFVLALSFYVSELQHDWLPDQEAVPLQRAAFGGLALMSFAALVDRRIWWLPAGFLSAAFAANFLFSIAPFSLGYTLWAAALVAVTAGLGWVSRVSPRRRPKGTNDCFS